MLLRLTAAAAALVLLAFALQQEPPARWWKGNLHTQTLWSDGDDFPDMVATWYRDHGYQFLALSEHNLLGQSERWMPSRAINRRAGVDAVARYRQRFGPSWVQSRCLAADGSEAHRPGRSESVVRGSSKSDSPTNIHQLSARDVCWRYCENAILKAG